MKKTEFSIWKHIKRDLRSEKRPVSRIEALWSQELYLVQYSQLQDIARHSVEANGNFQLIE